MAEHHSKELTKNLLRLLEQECKLIEARDKGKFDRKVEWFKETGLLKKQFKKPQNLSHERSKEYKLKERKNSWREQPKRKINEKKTNVPQATLNPHHQSCRDI